MKRRLVRTNKVPAELIQKFIALASQKKATTKTLLQELLKKKEETLTNLEYLSQIIVQTNVQLRPLGLRLKFSPQPKPGHWFLSTKYGNNPELTNPQKDLLIICFLLAFESPDGIFTMENLDEQRQRLARPIESFKKDFTQILDKEYIVKSIEDMIELTPKFFAELDTPGLLHAIQKELTI